MRGDAPGTSVARAPRDRGSGDLHEVDRLPGPEDDEGTSLLAGLAARHRDDRHVGDRGVGRQDVFDLLRADVLARADDDVLLPSRNHQIAPIHAAPEVAHAEVAVLVEGTDVVVGMQIADELLRPATRISPSSPSPTFAPLDGSTILTSVGETTSPSVSAPRSACARSRDPRVVVGISVDP